MTPQDRRDIRVERLLAAIRREERNLDATTERLRALRNDLRDVADAEVRNRPCQSVAP